jgi:hypothetical protein
MMRAAWIGIALTAGAGAGVGAGACGGGDDTSGGPDAPPGPPDGPPGAPDARPTDCAGDADRILIDGAYSFVHGSPGLVTIDGKVIGVSGAIPGQPPKTYSFVIRDIAAGDLDTVGAHDVAAQNLKFLEQPSGGCDTGGCTGFFAKAGTYTVTESAPRYRATFTLSDLAARTDATDTEGPALAGTITGCINAPR